LSRVGFCRLATAHIFDLNSVFTYRAVDVIGHAFNADPELRELSCKVLQTLVSRVPDAGLRHPPLSEIVRMFLCEKGDQPQDGLERCITLHKEGVWTGQSLALLIHMLGPGLTTTMRPLFNRILAHMKGVLNGQPVAVTKNTLETTWRALIVVFWQKEVLSESIVKLLLKPILHALPRIKDEGLLHTHLTLWTEICHCAGHRLTEGSLFRRVCIDVFTVALKSCSMPKAAEALSAFLVSLIGPGEPLSNKLQGAEGKDWAVDHWDDLRAMFLEYLKMAFTEQLSRGQVEKPWLALVQQACLPRDDARGLACLRSLVHVMAGVMSGSLVSDSVPFQGDIPDAARLLEGVGAPDASLIEKRLPVVGMMLETLLAHEAFLAHPCCDQPNFLLAFPSPVASISSPITAPSPSPRTVGALVYMTWAWLHVFRSPAQLMQRL
jgi:hypothetical protein